MRKSILSILLTALPVFTALTACSDSDETLTNLCTDVTVTVSGNALSGYRLYTDFDVILNPTNISDLPQLTQVERAVIAFTLTDETLTLDQLEAGRTYPIVLYPSYCYELPTFSNVIDTTDIAYIEDGQDSLSVNNEFVQAIDQTENAFYVKNGYLNLTATFGYSPSTPVRFSLFYDGNEDIDTANKSLTLHLYFNNGVSTPEYTTTSPLSFRLNELLYSNFLSGGVRAGDEIDIYLEASTVEDNSVRLHYQTELNELLQP